MKHLVCFDMDNTLLKSNKIHIEAFNQAFSEKELKKIPIKQLIPQLNGKQAHKIVKSLFPKLKPKIIKEIVDRHDELVVKKTYIHAKPIKGTEEALKEIKKHFTIAIISNCKKREIRPILKGAKIKTSCFHKIIGHDQVKHSKPYPDMIFKAEELTNHKAICMVGDSIYDIQAARRAKIKSIGVTTGNYNKEQLKKAGATTVVSNITKVPNALHKIFLIKK